MVGVPCLYIPVWCTVLGVPCSVPRRPVSGVGAQGTLRRVGTGHWAQRAEKGPLLLLPNSTVISRSRNDLRSASGVPDR